MWVKGHRTPCAQAIATLASKFRQLDTNKSNEYFIQRIATKKMDGWLHAKHDQLWTTRANIFVAFGEPIKRGPKVKKQLVTPLNWIVSHRHRIEYGTLQNFAKYSPRITQIDFQQLQHVNKHHSYSKRDSHGFPCLNRLEPQHPTGARGSCACKAVRFDALSWATGWVNRESHAFKLYVYTFLW